MPAPRATRDNAGVSSILPINLDDLLHCRGVESARIEFKSGWNPRTTGHQALKTICAFANDYHNLNGGYVVLGVGEEHGRGVMPPAGLTAAEIAAAGRWIGGHCNRLDPPYQPVVSPEVVAGRRVLVLWAPASDMKPHSAPDGPRGAAKYWIRLGAETVDAQANGLLSGLMAQTARVPWDDRRAFDARIEDLREAAVREFLRDVRSGLVDEPSAGEVYRRMRLTVRANGSELPRNIALLLFTDEPEHWFPGARTDVVLFPDGPAGDTLRERIFRGGLVTQLRGSFRYLESLLQTEIRKAPDRVASLSWTNYPLDAIREALVNALYHRSYQPDASEPTKVYCYPDRIDITSYPGPVPGIEPDHFLPGAAVPAMPARNRRVGEFFSELKLAERRLTGVPKIFEAMARNGSPPPRFDFDEGRTWFRATLPVHPGESAMS